jgi:hypothetical protein
MALEGSHETILPIPGISGRLKSFVQLWLILHFVNHHGIIITVVVVPQRDHSLFHCHWLERLGEYFSHLYRKTWVLTSLSLAVANSAGDWATLSGVDLIFDFDALRFVLGRACFPFECLLPSLAQWEGRSQPVPAAMPHAAPPLVPWPPSSLLH